LAKKKIDTYYSETCNWLPIGNWSLTEIIILVVAGIIIIATILLLLTSVL